MTAPDPRELEILRVLWESAPLKPAEIQARLPHPVKNSALRWQLENLMKKGHVKRTRRGKAYYYRATTPRHRILRAVSRRLAEVFSGGSAVGLIGQLIESQDRLSEEDLGELRRLAATKASSRKTPRKRGSTS